MNTNTMKRDTCPCCCPDVKRALFDATADQDGSPVWECRNCHETKPRRIRRTAYQMAAAELGLTGKDDTLESMLAIQALTRRGK